MTATAHTSPLASTRLVTPALVAAEVVGVLETTMSLQLLYAPKDFFPVSIAALTWILTAYTLSGAIAAAVGARLGDMFGRRKVLVGILALSALGSLISALAPAFWVLILGRAIQGVSLAVLPLCIGIISARYPRDRVNSAVTLVSSAAIISGALGVLLGGVVMSVISWHAIFWTTAVLAALCAGFLHWALPNDPAETLSRSHRVDWLGAGLFGIGITGVLFAVTSGTDLGWLDPQVLLTVTVGVAFLVAFVLWQRRATSPLFDLSVLQNPKIRNAMLMSLCLGFGPLGMYTAVSTRINLQPAEFGGEAIGVGLGLSPTMHGVVVAVVATLAFALSGLVGKMGNRLGAWAILVLGCGLGAFSLLVTLAGPTSTIFVIVGLAVFTIASVCLMSGVPALIVETVDPVMSSVTAAMAQNIRAVFQSVGSSVLGVLLSLGSINSDGREFVSFTGLTAAAVAIIAACAVVALLALRSKRAALPATDEPATPSLHENRPVARST